MVSSETYGLSYFNSRPSARGDIAGNNFVYADTISIHAPPRGATIIEQKYTFILIFQFTPLREGRRTAPGRNSGAEDFNSRPSARGDVQKGNLQNAQVISIHAPPRGATSMS